MASTDFSVDYVCPAKYKNLAAEISYQGQIVCEISQEYPSKGLEICFSPEARLLPAPVELKFPLAEFLELVDLVAKELVLCAERPDSGSGLSS